MPPPQMRKARQDTTPLKSVSVPINSVDFLHECSCGLERYRHLNDDLELTFDSLYESDDCPSQFVESEVNEGFAHAQAFEAKPTDTASSPIPCSKCRVDLLQEHREEYLTEMYTRSTWEMYWRIKDARTRKKRLSMNNTKTPQDNVNDEYITAKPIAERDIPFTGTRKKVEECSTSPPVQNSKCSATIVSSSATT